MDIVGREIVFSRKHFNLSFGVKRATLVARGVILFLKTKQSKSRFLRKTARITEVECYNLHRDEAELLRGSQQRQRVLQCRGVACIFEEYARTGEFIEQNRH